MADDFKANEKIILKCSKDKTVYDNDQLYTFNHTVTTDTTSGYLPSGSVLSSIETTSYKASGSNWHEVSDLIVSSEIAGYNNNYVLVSLKFPLTNMTGRYGIEFKITDTLGRVKVSWFENIRAVYMDGSY